MTQPNKSLKEAQHKIIHFLQEEVAKFKRIQLEPQNSHQRKITKEKKNNKKRQQLYQKIDCVLKLHSLEADMREELLSLQQEIKNCL